MLQIFPIPLHLQRVTTTYHVYSNNAASTCSNDDSVIAAVNTPIILNTNLSQDSACFGQSVQLMSIVSGGAGSGYIYSSANGSGNLVSTIANPLLFPIAAGVYHLTVSNGNCMASDDVIYTMVPIPVNIVSATPLNGCIPLTVTTTNNSTNANSYFWNAGNGNTYTAEAPAIVYNSCCTYTITYISTGLAGCTDTTIISHVLTDFPYPPATIFYEFGHLTATDFALYIWYFNGVEIPGNNGQHQPCDSAGFYQVLTSWNGVCYMLSDSFYFDCGQSSGIGIENTKPDNLFSFYPNPTSKEITVNYNLNTAGAFSIYNLLGKKR